MQRMMDIAGSLQVAYLGVTLLLPIRNPLFPYTYTYILYRYTIITETYTVNSVYLHSSLRVII